MQAGRAGRRAAFVAFHGNQGSPIGREKQGARPSFLTRQSASALAPSEPAILEAGLRRGMALLQDGALIALIANRREEEPAAVEAAMRELERRNPEPKARQRGRG